MESMPCDASHACRGKWSQNGCRNRTPIPCTSRRHQWQADLVDLSNLKKDNDGMNFFLTMIDVFSKVAWCEERVRDVVGSSADNHVHQRLTKELQTDQGLEFLNKSVQTLLKKYCIHHLSTHNAETKANIVERFNRTLKKRMWRYLTKHQTWRYIDILQDLVQSYNNTPTSASAWLRHR